LQAGVILTANGNLERITDLNVNGNLYDISLSRNQSLNTFLSTGGGSLFDQTFAGNLITALFDRLPTIPYNPNSVGNGTDLREFLIAPVTAGGQGSFVIIAGTKDNYSLSKSLYPSDYSGLVVNSGNTPSTNHYAFIKFSPALTPVPEPTSFAIFIALGCIVGRTRWRRQNPSM
jgi:hypothetical protein